MGCRHYFVEEVGYQPLSGRSARRLKREYFLLGQCVVCLTSLCADKYRRTGEFFEGHELLFSLRLEKLIKSEFRA